MSKELTLTMILFGGFIMFWIAEVHPLGWFGLVFFYFGIMLYWVGRDSSNLNKESLE